jgi:hypothetical protein
VAGWVALSSFSLDYAANTTIVSGSGALIGKATHSALTVELGLNQVLTTLMKNEVAGTAFTVQVEAYSHAGGDERRLVDETFSARCTPPVSRATAAPTRSA